MRPPPPPLPPHVGDDYPGTVGTWAVGHQSFTAVDGARANRSLNMDIWYPVDPQDAEFGNYRTYSLLGTLGPTSDVAIADAVVSTAVDRPLIVFSHGFGGISLQSTPLMEALASHGFIVVSPEHTGNSQNSPGDDWQTAATKRVPDVSFIIDTMIVRNNNPSDAFFGRINEAEIGVTGHSFGGATSMGMAVGWAGGAADSRVKAIAPISGEIELFETELTGLSSFIPVMLLGGTLDTSVPTFHNDLGFSLIPAPVYQTDVIGATHTHFSNVCAIADFLINDLHIKMNNWESIGAGALTDPYLDTCTPAAFPIDEVIRIQNLYVVSFFKKHLLNDFAYDVYLTTAHAVANEPDVAFSVK